MANLLFCRQLAKAKASDGTAIVMLFSIVVPARSDVQPGLPASVTCTAANNLAQSYYSKDEDAALLHSESYNRLRIFENLNQPGLAVE